MTDTLSFLARRLAPAALLVAMAALVGCGGDRPGEVSGTVSVDGQVPAEGSSITFVPTGQTAGGGGLIEGGKYVVKLVPGNYKVEIRVPKALTGAKPAPVVDGPLPGGPGAGGPGGSGGPANIEESLPAKYNDQTELTIEIKPGANPKNWVLTR
ncbi:MAG: hypothetical protein ACRC33_18965 [Gemmataceae bacterium]